MKTKIRLPDTVNMCFLSSRHLLVIKGPPGDFWIASLSSVHCNYFQIGDHLFYVNCNKVTTGQEKSAGVENGVVYFPVCPPLLADSSNYSSYLNKVRWQIPMKKTVSSFLDD